MVSLAALWLPILVSAIVVFVASSIIHMLLGYHAGDYRAVPSEDKVMDALRPFNIPPGDYVMPRPASAAAMKDPAYIEKHKRGPVGMLTVFPSGDMGMGRQLGGWFVFCLVVGLFAGYLTSRALPPGARYLDVHQFAGTVAFIGYSLALWEMTIWYRRDWKSTMKSTFDGLIYALLTGGVFGWLWPAA